MAEGNKGGRPKLSDDEKVDGARKRAIVPINMPCESKVKYPRPNTKIAALIDILSKPEGATMEEIAAELSKSGSPVTVNQARTWITYDLHELKGFGVRSEVETDNAGKQHLRCWILAPEKKEQKVA